MEDLETWKSIKDYEGLYEISSFGNVRRNGKILNPWINNGYYYISLSKIGIRKVRTIHQLSAIVFHNHIPNGYKLVINHKDFNRLNNRKDNLEITTQRENSNKKHIKSSSKLTGVSFVKKLNKWKSQIVIGTTVKYLGVFNSELEASEYYEKALKSLEFGNESEVKVKERNKTAKYKGVSWNKNTNKWRAVISINGKQKHLGLFNSESEASEKYKQEKLKL